MLAWVVWESGHQLASGFGGGGCDAQVRCRWQRVCLGGKRLGRAGGDGGEVTSVAEVGLKLTWCAVMKGTRDGGECSY